MNQFGVFPRPSAGLRHRLVQCLTPNMKLRGIAKDETVTFYWPCTAGVGYATFEDLFAPIDHVKVVNMVSQHSYVAWSKIEARRNDGPFALSMPGDTTYLFDEGNPDPNSSVLSVDLDAFKAKIKAPALQFAPNAHLSELVEKLDAVHKFKDRTGIRIRVDERATGTNTWGRPHRDNQAEIDAVLKPILARPKTEPVFIVSDSMYVQKVLCEHFNGPIRPTRVDVPNKDGYTKRDDQRSVILYVIEAFCLLKCKQILNVGGFLTDQLCHEKIVNVFTQV